MRTGGLFGKGTPFVHEKTTEGMEEGKKKIPYHLGD